MTDKTTPDRCEGRYPVPHKRDEPFEVTYRCALQTGHDGPHGSGDRPQPIGQHASDSLQPMPAGAAPPLDTPQELTFEVVVNGQPVNITIAASVNVRAVIEPALAQTGTVSRLDSEWEVRLADGGPLQLDQPIAAYVGQRLWINLRAGYAANHEPSNEDVNALTAIVREADRTFERVGGSSRHWVRDCFYPLLSQHGWRLERASLPLDTPQEPVPPLMLTRMRTELERWLDTQHITGDTIGDIRRSCFVPWDSEWNGIVRDETAKREKAVSHPLDTGECRCEDVDGMARYVNDCPNEYHAERARRAQAKVDTGEAPTEPRRCTKDPNTCNVGICGFPRCLTETVEQQARDLLDRMGVPDAQAYTSGDLVELANLIADRRADTGEAPTEPELPQNNYARRLLVEAQEPTESIRVAHARKQGAADGFQQGWHAALQRLRDGDKIHDLAELVPQFSGGINGQSEGDVRGDRWQQHPVPDSLRAGRGEGPGEREIHSGNAVGRNQDGDRQPGRVGAVQGGGSVLRGLHASTEVDGQGSAGLQPADPRPADTGEATPAPPDDYAFVEMELRKRLWFGHGHSGQYGDDGEMQCGECLRVDPPRLFDYKRTPIRELVAHVRRIQLQQLAKAFPSLPSAAEKEHTT